jgi:hypothetical protein
VELARQAMTGPQIEAVRRDLCLSTERMAQLLHVPPLTLARWIASPPTEGIDGVIGHLTAATLAYIGRQIVRKRALGEEALHAWANEIHEALAVSTDGLRALAVILRDLQPLTLPETKP